MNKQGSRSGRASSVPSGLAWGTAVSMMITVLGSMGLGKLVDSQIIPWEQIGYWIMVMLLAASYLGPWVAYRKIKRQRLLVCMLCAMVYWAGLLSVTALFFGGQYEAVGVTACVILGGSAVAALPVPQHRRGGKRIKLKTGTW